ncbi:hypothetical protein I4574_11105 [Proteus mirabilis]|nr:hypothetical protein [Proteus mirabilis]MBG2778344.1 hypothetical protein [Proteus mirabilis]MBG2794613.1 hypothetical protein [Proteus mirabilis]HCT2303299.1 hypothetical protein [Proteus mirabilis]
MNVELTLRTIGTVLSVIGSILITWRGYNILKWVKLTLNAHEISLVAIKHVLNNRYQPVPMIEGMTTHLDNYEDGPGAKLLVVGFIAIVAGVLCSAISFWV